MALFGKSKIKASKLCAEYSMFPTRQEVEEGWWPIIEEANIPVGGKSRVLTELLHLELFAVDLAICAAFKSQTDVRDAMRDQIHLYAARDIPEILDDIPIRQQLYGEALANHSFPDLPETYSVIKKFNEISEIADDPVFLMGLTKAFISRVTITKDFFGEIQDLYRVVP